MSREGIASVTRVAMELVNTFDSELLSLGMIASDTIDAQCMKRRWGVR